MKDESFYLRHILDAIEKAEEYLRDLDEVSFVRSTLVQDGVIRQIEIIGEATKRLSADLRGHYNPAFVSTNKKRDGTTRKLKVDVQPSVPKSQANWW